jgi:hypothetical protein
MRRHFESSNGAAESFVSCIPLFDGLVVAPHIVAWLSKVEIGDLRRENSSACAAR